MGFMQYSKLDNAAIRDILSHQQEAELFFQTILQGYDPESAGEKFFQFMNPRIVKLRTRGNCNNCGTENFNTMSDPEELGVLNVPLPVRGNNGETLESLTLS